MCFDVRKTAAEAAAAAAIAARDAAAADGSCASNKGGKVGIVLQTTVTVDEAGS